MSKKILDTHQKALEVNLDSNKYGALAEIGAGQEVASWLFRVGAAAGTVAKTMSAYDMAVSDAIYGKSGRYVSKDRLEAMLDHEWGLLLERLDNDRGADSTFFVFADTVSARNYQGTNICHGWVGISFQSEPRGEPNRILLHINMLDNTNVLQQRAIGILGINLIHAAFYSGEKLDDIMPRLQDDLGLNRLDIDYIEVSGPRFEEIEPREALLSLLNHQLTKAVAFDAEGDPVPPISLLYKRPIILERGTFHKVEYVHSAILDTAGEHFDREGHQSKRPKTELFEITINSANDREIPSISEVGERIALLRELGKPILVTAYAEGYHLTRFLRRYTQEPIRFSLGISHLMQLFDEKYYQHLSGGIVEGIGRLISTGVKLYVCPMAADNLRVHLEKSGMDTTDWECPSSGTASISNVRPISATRHLYSYMFEIGALMPMREPRQSEPFQERSSLSF